MNASPTLFDDLGYGGVVPADTPVPPTDTPAPPTDTPAPPTDTPVPPTSTPGGTVEMHVEDLVITNPAGDPWYNFMLGDYVHWKVLIRDQDGFPVVTEMRDPTGKVKAKDRDDRRRRLGHRVQDPLAPELDGGDLYRQRHRRHQERGDVRSGRQRDGLGHLPAQRILVGHLTRAWPFPRGPAPPAGNRSRWGQSPLAQGSATWWAVAAMANSPPIVPSFDCTQDKPACAGGSAAR
jgi:hypothetical protein